MARRPTDKPGALLGGRLTSGGHTEFCAEQMGAPLELGVRSQ